MTVATMLTIPLEIVVGALGDREALPAEAEDPDCQRAAPAIIIDGVPEEAPRSIAWLDHAAQTHAHAVPGKHALLGGLTDENHG
jgi:hypothetical protein